VTLVAGLALVGCGHSDATVQLDATLDDADQGEVRRAGSAWGGVAASQFRFSDHGDWLVIRADVPDGFNGYTEPDRKIIRIRPEVPTDLVYTVAVHELGHVLKLEHTCVSPNPHVSAAAPGAPPCGDVSHGVMDPDNGANTIGSADLEECRRVGACD
jgi:hypothetical protein